MATTTSAGAAVAPPAGRVCLTPVGLRGGYLGDDGVEVGDRVALDHLVTLEAQQRDAGLLDPPTGGRNARHLARVRAVKVEGAAEERAALDDLSDVELNGGQRGEQTLEATYLGLAHRRIAVAVELDSVVVQLEVCVEIARVPRRDRPVEGLTLCAHVIENTSAGSARSRILESARAP